MSNLRFFVDHCISNFIITVLRGAGYEVLRLKDYIPPDSPDVVVIAKARELGTILVSLNSDFADIITYPPADYQGIIALQVRDHPEIVRQLMEKLEEHLSTHQEMSYYKGKLFLVEVHRIRVQE